MIRNPAESLLGAHGRLAPDEPKEQRGNAQENAVGGNVAGLCVICYAVSTSLGALVAKLDDVFIADGARGQGVGSAMLAALGRALKAENVLRIDTAVHLKNAEAARFYARCGFKPLNEERLSLLL